MPPSDFATTDIDEVLHELTTDESILLIAGVGFWYTHSVERLGIPAIKVLVFHVLHNQLITLSSSLAMVRMVYEERTSLWDCLQSVCR
jgi:hypothetical protein